MKTNYILAVMAIAFLVGACRKERTCECKTKETVVRNGFGAKTTEDVSTSKFTMEKQRKGSFKYSADCFSQTYDYNSSGGNGNTAWNSVTTEEITCELK